MAILLSLRQAIKYKFLQGTQILVHLAAVIHFYYLLQQAGYLLQQPIILEFQHTELAELTVNLATLYLRLRLQYLLPSPALPQRLR